MKTEKMAYIYYGKYNTDDTFAVQIINTTNALSSLGYDVHLINTAGARQFALSNDLTIDAQVHQPPMTFKYEVPDRIIYYIYCIFKVCFTDIIFTRDIGFLKFVSHLPLDFDTPIIYEGHQCYSGINAMSAHEERSRLKQADVIITQSLGVADDLESNGISVTEVIHNAANEQFIPDKYPQSLADRYGIDDDWTTVIYSGSLHEWKNDIKLLIKTIPSVDEKIKLLVIGGNKKQIKKLQQFARDQGLSPNTVVFVGRIPHREVYEYLAIADIGVVPLKPGTPQSTKYTSPVKLFEYLASELRVVASDVPAVRSIENPNIQYYNPGDVDSVRNSLINAASEDFQKTDTSYTYTWRAERISEIVSGLQS